MPNFTVFGLQKLRSHSKMRRMVQKLSQRVHNSVLIWDWIKKRIMMPGLRCLQIKTIEVVFEQNGSNDMSSITDQNWILNTVSEYFFVPNTDHFWPKTDHFRSKTYLWTNWLGIKRLIIVFNRLPFGLNLIFIGNFRVKTTAKTPFYSKSC